jgi:cobalt-zinc-cadmium efflux system outer membrane protein
MMKLTAARNAGRIWLVLGIWGLALIGPGASESRAQAMLADDVIILSKGQRAKQQARMKEAGSPTPGSGISMLPPIPGGAEGAAMPGGMPGESQATQRATSGPAGVLSAASGYSTAFSGRPEQARTALPPALPSPRVPQYGTIEIPQTEDEGPEGGITLDMAIEMLIHQNADLGARFKEIPKSQADILTAGLIANPIVFASADSIPYGTYSPTRPGSNGYGIVLVQPIDINRKRKVRVMVAEQARNVVQAQYQNEVRLSIERLGTAFVDVLEARENVRYKEANLRRLGELVSASELLYRKGNMPRSELDRALILRDSAGVELDAAQSAFLEAKQNLAGILHMEPGAAASVQVRGRLREACVTPPSLDELICLARMNRPDVVAYRLGVRRAQEEVRLARAERFEDVFLFYTPYGFTNFAYQNQQSATSWSIGGLVSIPLFNRNQGNIARARHVVDQTVLALNGLERQVATEVQRAWQAHQTADKGLERLEKGIVPRARRYRDDQYRLFTAGEQDIAAYYNAERDYNDVIVQYRDALIRHRRSMLRLNTVVGQRIFP